MPSSPSGASSLPSLTAPVPVPFHSSGPAMYKNHLQEFSLRSGNEFPVYQTINEGVLHTPKFRSTVRVAGMTYTSKSTFPQKKAAEQDVARLALESILEKTRKDGPSLVSEISPLCKSIINEYATKLHIEGPSYNTVQQQHSGGVLPVFTSSLVFNGTSYTGDHAKTKKEAEQSAAQAAILSIMGDSRSGSKLIEIIKSKSIFYEAIKAKGLPLLQASEVLQTPNSKDISVTLLDPKKEVKLDSVVDKSEVKVEHTKSSEINSTCEKQESSLQATLPLQSGSAHSIGNDLSSERQESSLQATPPLQPDSAHSIDNDLSSKRRRRNKKKANKKQRLESSLPNTGLPMNEAPPSTSVP
ncbi:double-stranded RNA-binding protein 7 [Vigna radiata var. radiata]|uniref:Double-stranded RNA-binding protein 7 n=1 Tax=Vigna radiata var. radiata TaxID=3916 RepID=A0A1S3U9W6_VIGRR|nr:double-stranded RNA-binding protein 7 [Vigna radiata var. radiata]